ncbi:hypothetical protein E4U61_003045 [Claviceps capensis]|nr:hypothetical protein E4U61_003045 [Claviceps capensis]
MATEGISTLISDAHTTFGAGDATPTCRVTFAPLGSRFGTFRSEHRMVIFQVDPPHLRLVTRPQIRKEFLGRATLRPCRRVCASVGRGVDTEVEWVDVLEKEGTAARAFKYYRCALLKRSNNAYSLEYLYPERTAFILDEEAFPVENNPQPRLLTDKFLTMDHRFDPTGETTKETRPPTAPTQETLIEADIPQRLQVHVKHGLTSFRQRTSVVFECSRCCAFYPLCEDDRANVGGKYGECDR